MKHLRKILAVCLSLCLSFSFSISAFASTTPSIGIEIDFESNFEIVEGNVVETFSFYDIDHKQAFVKQVIRPDNTFVLTILKDNETIETTGLSNYEQALSFLPGADAYEARNTVFLGTNTYYDYLSPTYSSISTLTGALSIALGKYGAIKASVAVGIASALFAMQGAPMPLWLRTTISTYEVHGSGGFLGYYRMVYAVFSYITSDCNGAGYFHTDNGTYDSTTPG